MKKEYIKTAVIVLAAAGAAAVIWTIASPFIRKARIERLDSVESASGISASSQPETDDGSGEAGRVRIGDDRGVEFDVPGWQHNDQGWWYAADEYTYLCNGWHEIDGKNYHFSRDGYMDTGWTAIGGRGYYFADNGEYQPDADLSKVIALTFDDGPGEYTADLLNTLEENGAKATFFMLGQCVEQYGEENIPKMVSLGCELGNHSYDHTNMKTVSTDEALEQFQKTDELIAGYNNGTGASLIRFPYGNYTDEEEAGVGKPCIYWDYDSQDWKGTEAATLADTALNTVSGGNILLFHDIHENSVEAMKILIPKLKEEGYQMVTVSELAASRGYDLENGVTYFGFSDLDIQNGRVSDKQ